MPEMINVETGERTIVSPEQAPEMFLSGKFAFRKGERLSVINTKNQLVSIPTESADQALRSGYRFESTQESKERHLQQKYGEGFLPALTAVVGGAARGASMYGSDIAVAKLLGPKGAEAIREVKKRHPYLSLTSEIGGIGLSVAAGPGLLGRVVGGATAPVRGVGAAGRAVESAVTRGIAKGVGEQASKSLVSKVLAGSAGFATEGMAYSAAHAISEDVLEGKEITADKLVSAVKWGALVGGGAGAALKLGGPAANIIGGKAAASIAGRLSEGNLKGWLEGFAERRALKALIGGYYGPYKKLTAKQRVNAAGKYLLENKIVTGKEGRIEQIFEKLTDRKDNLGRQLDEILATLDEAVLVKAGPGLTAAGRPRVARAEGLINPVMVAQRIRNEILPDILKVSAEDPATYNFLTKYIDDLEKQGAIAMKFSDARARRAALQDKVEWGREIPESKKVYAKLQSLWNKVIDEKAEPILDAAIGKARAKTYRQVRHEFSLVEDLFGYAKDRIDREAARRIISPSDYGVGAVGAIMSAAPGGVPTGIGGLAAAVGHKIIRERGNAIAADVAYRASRLGFIQKATNEVTRAVRKKVRSSLRPLREVIAVPASLGIMERIKLDPATRKSKADTRVDVFRKRSKELSAIISDPENTATQLQKSWPDVEEVAPNLMTALTTKAIAGATFLWDKMPKDPRGEEYLLPHMSKWEPSEAAMSKWERYIAAVDDPMSVLDDMKNGVLTREAVEAIKAVNPELYSEMVTQVIEQLPKLQEDLPYERLSQLSILLDMPLHPTQTGQFVATMQANYAREGEVIEPKGPPPSRGMTTIATNTLTEGQRIAFT
jgi:hypothetical protein